MNTIQKKITILVIMWLTIGFIGGWISHSFYVIRIPNSMIDRKQGHLFYMKLVPNGNGIGVQSPFDSYNIDNCEAFKEYSTEENFVLYCHDEKSKMNINTNNGIMIQNNSEKSK